MTSPAAQLLTVTAIMLVADAVWLTARGAASRTMFAALQGSPLTIRWPAVILVYALMAIGLWWFVVRPATSVASAATNGAALGALVYGVYDMTNYATLSRFSLSYALADWLWGTVLFAGTAALTAAMV